jgi:hypothetical protein
MRGCRRKSLTRNAFASLNADRPRRCLVNDKSHYFGAKPHFIPEKVHEGIPLRTMPAARMGV